MSESIRPRKYSARLVSHKPGSALASGDNMRSASAHSDTVSVDGGANAASVRATSLHRAGGKFVADDEFALERGRPGGESTKGGIQFFLQQGLRLCGCFEGDNARRHLVRDR